MSSEIIFSWTILVVKLKAKHEVKFIKALRYNNLGLFCLGVLFTITLNACSPKISTIEQQRIAGTTMGTSYSIQFYFSESKERAKAQKELLDIKRAAEQRLEAIEQSMSTYRQSSELSRLNEARTGDWIVVSHELMFVLHAAQKVSELSQGGFDISVGPLVNLWGFGPDYSLRKKPKQADISAVLEQGIGYRFLELDQEKLRVKKLKPLYLDLSAIAKGYAVDSLASLLDEYGVENYLVEIGGELKASGTKPNKQVWRIAVEKPILDVLASQREIENIMPLDNIAIASSGDYRNFFKDEGIVYSHTINPKTGLPVTHGLASVTVLHSSCMQADALATAFMVMGPEKSLQLANELALPVLFIVREGEAYTQRLSSRMKTFLNEKKPL